ncbi:MAG: hypothetical protein ING19_13905 [Azospirillum sp.]|nr:hypothetical protein [Azospirillum sp.]
MTAKTAHYPHVRAAIARVCLGLATLYRDGEPGFGSRTRMIDFLRHTARTAGIDSASFTGISMRTGFAQGYMAAEGLIDVDEERARTRPIFHEAYKAEGIVPPKSKSHPSSGHGFDFDRTAWSNIEWMLEKLVEDFKLPEGSRLYPIDKAGRWLGFVEGVMARKFGCENERYYDSANFLFRGEFDLAAELGRIRETVRKKRDFDWNKRLVLEFAKECRAHPGGVPPGAISLAVRSEAVVPIVDVSAGVEPEHLRLLVEVAHRLNVKLDVPVYVSVPERKEYPEGAEDPKIGVHAFRAISSTPRFGGRR